MATRVRVDLYTEGIREILLSNEVRQDMIRRANLVATRARARRPTAHGQLVPIDVIPGTHPHNRHHVWVRLNHDAGMAIEARHRILASSIDAAGADN